MQDEQESSLVRHIPCESCGSSDGNGLYDDGHTYCFVCEKHVKATDLDGSPAPVKSKPKRNGSLINDIQFRPLNNRGIRLETVEKFGYSIVKFKGEWVQCAPYYAQDGSLSGQKLRLKSKDFPALGVTKGCQLFGQKLWRKGGKKLIITEGELDCMSVSQAQGNKWPVVSLTKGAGGAVKDIANNIDFVTSFEEVVLWFDADDAGREAIEKVAALLGNKCSIVEQTEGKDANDLLKLGQVKELIDYIWRAKPYSPEGLTMLGEFIEEASKPTTMGLSTPWPELTEIMLGLKTHQLIGIGAATGAGKTTFMLEMAKHLVCEHKEKVGLILLEQHPAETAKRIAGLYENRPFHVPLDTLPEESKYTKEELRRGLKAADDSDSYHVYNHFGVANWDSVASSIRFWVEGCDVKYIILDHLTALAACEEDERKALERIMAEVGGLVQELDVTVIYVSHLATPEGTPHEEGGRIQMRHFKGSRAIGFWTTMALALERDQQDLAGDTTVRCLKDRETGRSTGKTFQLRYDPDTGRQYVPPTAGMEDFEEFE